MGRFDSQANGLLKAGSTAWIVLSKHSKGIVGFSGCLAREISQLLLHVERYNEFVPHQVELNRDAILRIASNHGARNVRVFGSVARGDDGPASDIDFLVKMDDDRSLLDLVGLSQELEVLLQRRVDVLTDDGLHPALRQRINLEARVL